MWLELLSNQESPYCGSRFLAITRPARLPSMPPTQKVGARPCLAGPSLALIGSESAQAVTANQGAVRSVLTSPPVHAGGLFSNERGRLIPSFSSVFL